MTQALFWVGMVAIVLGVGFGYWDLRDRLGRIESDLKHLYHELGRHEGEMQSLRAMRAKEHPRSTA